MPQWLKILAVLCCVLPFVNVVIRLTRPEPRLAPMRPEMRGRGVSASDDTVKRVILAMVILAELGAVILLIDAILRKSDSPKAWPIAIAFMGLLSMGMGSLVYFAIWGWRPTRPIVAWAQDFCDACKEATIDKSVRGAGMHNMMGTAFLGHSSLCKTCGSSIRTLWIWVLLPIVPIGSYRVLPVGNAMAHKSWMISRKAPLNIIQIAVCYSFVAAILIAIWWMATHYG